MIYSFECSLGAVVFTDGVFSCSDPAGTVTAQEVAYAIDTTDPTTHFNDGLTLGWGVVAAMAAAWAVVSLRKALFR